ncbi:MAG TPA: Lrp/AsnC ligand binding domain-containing protein [Candidatus Thermoplasmatota archaeon]|nr:Lrp/AsnC ligand binding domain-containing protein [Candidatus Thermoplasmatota archaeon]
MRAYLLVSTEAERQQEVTKRLRATAGVTWAYGILGRADLAVRVEATGLREFRRTLEAANAIPGVVRTQTLLDLEAL